MTTLDKAKFTYQAYKDPTSFDEEMANLPQKDRTINAPRKIVVLMTNIFAPDPKKNSGRKREEEHFMNSRNMTAQERLDYLLEKAKQRKWSQNPIIR